jgi:hypothetical protein
MGTPAFMAPEQARGRWDEVDGRTDLWAVGATMFTLLSGRFVHQAASEHERMIVSATRRAPSLATVAPGMPVAVTAIVDRALAFERSERWADAGSMQRAVRTALDALGGSAPFSAAPRQHTVLSGGLVSGVVSGVTTHVSSATAIDTSTLGSAVTAWTTERDLRASESTRLRSSIAELQQRHAETKKRASETQAKVDAGREERGSLDHWFKRQVGTRTAAVEEARGQVRRQMVAIAKRALADRATFASEFDPARERIATLELAAASAARDVKVHEAALGSYDVRSMRRGVVVSALLVLVLVVAPVVWRAVRVVEPPPPPHHSATGR